MRNGTFMIPKPENAVSSVSMALCVQLWLCNLQVRVPQSKNHNKVLNASIGKLCTGLDKLRGGPACPRSQEAVLDTIMTVSPSVKVAIHSPVHS